MRLLKRIRGIEGDIKILYKEATMNGPYRDRVRELEEKVWQLENPPEFRVGEEVRFDGGKKKGRYSGILIITDMNIESWCSTRFRRKYTAVHKKSGKRKSCIPGSVLIKAK